MASRPPSASMGFAVKSGWAALVVLTGAPADPPVIEQARVVTAQELAGLKLREAVPMSRARAAGGGSRFPLLPTAALLLILACNLALVFLGSRWHPRTRATINGAAAVVGVVLLIAQYAG